MLLQESAVMHHETIAIRSGFDADPATMAVPIYPIGGAKAPACRAAARARRKSRAV